MSDEKLAWSPMPDGSLIIDMQGIYKRLYIGQPNELEILKGIDLQVGRGEFVSIVGASGSGKSTLMNIIGALDTQTGHMVMDLFHRLHREEGKTIVLITHNPELAAETERIVTISDGRIIRTEKGGMPRAAV